MFITFGYISPEDSGTGSGAIGLCGSEKLEGFCVAFQGNPTVTTGFISLSNCSITLDSIEDTPVDPIFV